VHLVGAVDGWSRARALGGPMRVCDTSSFHGSVWEVDLVVPEGALVINFVVNDGHHAFDNNGGQVRPRDESSSG
jgi:hypothetical protein